MPVSRKNRNMKKSSRSRKISKSRNSRRSKRNRKSMKQRGGDKTPLQFNTNMIKSIPFFEGKFISFEKNIDGTKIYYVISIKDKINEYIRGNDSKEKLFKIPAEYFDIYNRNTLEHFNSDKKMFPEPQTQILIKYTLENKYLYCTIKQQPDNNIISIINEENREFTLPSILFTIVPSTQPIKNNSNNNH